jgi:pyruvate formate lyase activating enzyme
MVHNEGSETNAIGHLGISRTMPEPIYNPSQDHPGRWWDKLADGRLQCNLCPRYCKIPKGKRGFCFVRQNIDHSMVLTTYGRSSGFCIDPVEKKPLNHFHPGTSVLSFGTAGCNLGCRFCQNWDISKARQMDRLTDFASPESIAKTALKHHCRSVAFTYNDPVIFAEYAIDIAKACHDRDVRTIAVTAGYITQDARQEFFNAMDAVNVDLKGFTDQFYEKLCFARLNPVLDTLKYLYHETDVWFEITTLLIPERNDSSEELDQLTDWIIGNLGPDVPLHFTAFHPDFKMKDTPATPDSTLKRARSIALGKGLNFVYTGNIHDPAGGSTWCPGCAQLLVERDWYQVGKYNIQDGKCIHCGAAVRGHFPDQCGNWGRRRLRVGITS